MNWTNTFAFNSSLKPIEVFFFFLININHKDKEWEKRKQQQHQKLENIWMSDNLPYRFEKTAS